MAEEELGVDVLSERVIVTSPGLGQEARTVAVTFRAPGLPPLTVWIPEEEDTPEGRAAAIRARIQEFTVTPAKKVKV